MIQPTSPPSTPIAAWDASRNRPAGPGRPGARPAALDGPGHRSAEHPGVRRYLAAARSPPPQGTRGESVLRFRRRHRTHRRQQSRTARGVTAGPRASRERVRILGHPCPPSRPGTGDQRSDVPGCGGGAILVVADAVRPECRSRPKGSPCAAIPPSRTTGWSGTSRRPPSSRPTEWSTGSAPPGSTRPASSPRCWTTSGAVTSPSRSTGRTSPPASCTWPTPPS